MIMNDAFSEIFKGNQPWPVYENNNSTTSRNLKAHDQERVVSGHRLFLCFPSAVFCLKKHVGRIHDLTAITSILSITEFN